MPNFEPHSPRELRAHVHYYFTNARHYITKGDEHRAAQSARRLAHFGLRLLEHPTIQKEFEKARKLAELEAKHRAIVEYEKAVAEADAAVVARLTEPVEG